MAAPLQQGPRGLVRCEPTVHRFVQKFFIPTPHRLLESRPEPTFHPPEMSFSPPLREAACHSRLPFSGGPGSSAWRKSPDIQALPEGATTVADRGFNAAGSQRTIRCSTVGRHHDWHKAKRCAVGSSLPNPKRCAVGKSDAMRCRLACSLVRRYGRLRLAHLAAERLDLGPGGR